MCIIISTHLLTVLIICVIKDIEQTKRIKQFVLDTIIIILNGGIDMLMPSIFGENLFDNFFNDFMSPTKQMVRFNTPVSSVMKTDIKDTENGYELDIDLPGYQKEDVTAELKDGCLTISASTKSENDEKDSEGRYVRRERYYGSCSRSFRVGEHLTQEDIKARFENGVLKLYVPKKEVKPVLEDKKYIMIEG